MSANTAEPELKRQPSKRINSLDQFRGYTVAGMLLVNYLGSCKNNAEIPRFFLHTHDYCSFADTIMPQFLFAVGFALRLTIGRRVEPDGNAAANWRMVRRIFGLILISILIYSRPTETWNNFTAHGLAGTLPQLIKNRLFETLMHIAVTSLWILPVIRKSVRVRITWMLLSAALHVGLSYWFNFDWVYASPNGVNGGPLGFLTWTVPAIVGTLACDFIADSEGRPQLKRLVLWSCLLMGFGWFLSCGTRVYDVPAAQVEELKGERFAVDPVFPSAETLQTHFQKPWRELLAEPPFIPPPNLDHRKLNYWLMSLRGGTLSFLIFSAGFSLLIYVLFYAACDIGHFRSRFFQAFGVNALAAYVLHTWIVRLVKRGLPEESNGWHVFVSLIVFFALNYLIMRLMEKRKIFWRL